MRDSANTIRAVHRGDLGAAETLLAATRAVLLAIEGAVAGHPDLRYTGYVDEAEKEYAEASITMCMVAGTPFPGPEELGVSYTAYLNGMAEAASEMRRHLLGALRRNELPRCEAMLAAMDFPEALTGGLRHSTDQLRSVLERTRGDLTLAIVQDRLAAKLAAAERRADALSSEAEGRRFLDLRPEARDGLGEL